MLFGQNTASWQDAEALLRRLAANEEAVRRGFWRKLRGLAASLPFAEDLIAAHYCAFDQQTPLHVKAVLLGAIAYFVVPTDLIPDLHSGDRLHRRRRGARHRDQSRRHLYRADASRGGAACARSHARRSVTRAARA